MHKFTLEPYTGPSSRYDCPSCNQRKRLSRYIDTDTDQHLAAKVGKCDRENKCGYHYKQNQYFDEAGGNIMRNANCQMRNERKKKTSAIDTPNSAFNIIPSNIFKQSLKTYGNNNFITWCIGLFGEEIVSELISRYLIGTSKHWNSATVFWQVDSKGAIRTGKIMLYDTSNGKRVKKPFNHINWVHTVVRK